MAISKINSNSIAESQTLVTPVISGLMNLQGGQIKFPAAQIPSSDANTLDDYEEGTWTPSLTGSAGGSASGVTAVGHYTKVGRLITVNCYLSYAKNTLSTYATVQGLPFPAGDTSLAVGSLLMDQMTAQNYNPVVQLSNGLTTVIPIIGNYGVGNHDQLQWSSKNGNQGTIRFTLSYMTA